MGIWSCTWKDRAVDHTVSRVFGIWHPLWEVRYSFLARHPRPRSHTPTEVYSQGLSFCLEAAVSMASLSPAKHQRPSKRVGVPILSIGPRVWDRAALNLKKQQHKPDEWFSLVFVLPGE